MHLSCGRHLPRPRCCDSQTLPPPVALRPPEAAALRPRALCEARSLNMPMNAKELLRWRHDSGIWRERGRKPATCRLGSSVNSNRSAHMPCARLHTRLLGCKPQACNTHRQLLGNCCRWLEAARLCDKRRCAKTQRRLNSTEHASG